MSEQGDQGSESMIDVAIVAQKIAASTRHVRRLADAGRMPAPVKVGRLLRWRTADVDGWILNGCKPVRDAGRAGR